jgi:glycosyltransferase involved in cell wall biosynthesis
MGGSHAAWAEGLVRHSGHHVHLVALPARQWRWRLRGGAIALARAAEGLVTEHGPPDVVLASDLVDVSAFLGLTRRWLGDPAVALYLHESQLVHPTGRARGARDGGAVARSVAAGDEAVAANWRSLLVADRVLVNSAFHRDALLAALPAWLARLPEAGGPDELGAVSARMEVLPVGVELRGLGRAERRSSWPAEPPLVLWNQRWDHDKRPEALLRVLVALAEAGVPFRLALAGERTRVDPREFTDAVARLGPRVVHVGHLAPEAYRRLLLGADVVVSTAAHEFFGVAPVEAMAAGAVPLLPDRLSYPELVPRWAHDAVLYRGGLFERLRTVLDDLAAARRRVHGLRAAMGRYDWSVLAPRYDEVLDSVVPSSSGPRG